MIKPETKKIARIAKSQLIVKRYITACLLTLFSALTAWGQSGKLFNTDNKLSSNLVTQVYQDTNGFIWITTRNGINVYDGYNFTVIKKNADDKRGLNTNYINCINQDQVGHLLLGTNKGLLCYDGQLFTNIILPKADGKPAVTYVTHIYKKKNGEVIVGTSGFGLFVMKGEEHTCRALTQYGGKLQYIRKTTEDNRGNLWVITEGRQLYKIEKNGKLAENIPGTEGLRVEDLQTDPRTGKLYLATQSQGIYEMSAGSTVFTRIPSINLSSASSLYIAKNGSVLIGCDGDGISVYNPLTHQLYLNPFFSAQINLHKSKVQNVIEDAQGNIWFSMLQKGVFMQPQSSYDFGYMGFRLGNRNVIGDNCVNSIHLDREHTLWVGTDKDGLYKLSADGQQMRGHYMEGSTILSICQDLKGRIWVGTYTDGMGYIDGSGAYHRVDIPGMGTAGTFDIKCDRWGNLWLATMGAGLICIPEQGSPIIYKVKNRADQNNHINSIPNDYIAKLAFSKDQSRIYIATSIGLACLDRKKNSWTSAFGGTNLTNKDHFSHCVYVDSKNRIWYGTEEGLYCYNPSNMAKPKLYTTAKGLSDNSIASIIEDCKGRIWLGTASGLSKLNVEKGEVSKFYVENGIQSNEFSDGAICTTPDKRYVFIGGTGGFNYFDATQVKQHPWTAKVIVSGFILGDEHVVPGMESGFYNITEKGVYDSEQFDLAHDDNTFTLQLSTLTYSNVEQIVYSYSINGEEWHNVQPGLNEISFSHLPAGTYHFRIKAACNQYETPVKEFTVTIHPAWYASTWARLAYLLAFIGLCMLYIQHRKRKEEDRMLLQKHIHAEEMGEAKIKFFMNISHEIRTPLTLILTPLLSLIKEDKDPHRQGIYDIMHKNSERILHLINQMMDLRKIDKGQMVMRMSQTDMVGFMKDEYELFHQQAVAKNIDFQYEHDSEKLDVWIDRNNFDKVLMNVLSNAFKFTPTGGKVKMSLRHTEHHAYISIKDNGCGIPKDKLETIFQRFYQSPTSSTDRNIGTGIGLDLTRSLVELHYGTISAHNNQDGDDPDFQQGSEFLISLPMGCEHLKPEEMITLEEEKAEEEKTEMDDLQEEKIEEEEKPTEPIGEQEQELEVSKRKSTIAIVEDDDEIQQYLAAQLSADFNILAYPNGKVALQEIRKQQPDLVISDIMMPEMDGTTLCTKLKSQVTTNHIPVILLTAMSREEDQLAGLQTGADAYIVKPFNMDILRRTILNLLSVRRTLRNKFEGKEGLQSSSKPVELQTPDDLLLAKVTEVVQQNLNDSDLSVDMIAQQVGISRVHLHRKMKELTNQTPHIYIRNVRLKVAAQMLAESKQSVIDVMFACGFSNAASFSTMFKNMYGMAPRDYMNKKRKK